MIKTSPLPSPCFRNRVLTIVEVVLILLVFYLFGGGPPPDVNESHYLAKAKHFWNPTWCAGDPFLESHDAHLVFNWTFGWLTLLFSLPTVAWIGRLLTWGLLAWSWQRLSFTLIPRPLFSLLSAGLFLFFLSRFHLAGEWVVGGVEAKGFAFVLVFLALDALVQRRWRSMWLLLGAATCFHVLVGGWSIIAAGFASLAAGKERPSVGSQIPAVALAILLALPGVVPALMLTTGVDAETVREANVIYVYQRLPHHLAPHTFSPMTLEFRTGEEGEYLAIIRLPNGFVLRHIALLLAWFALWLVVRRDEWQSRLYGFVAGAVMIMAIGSAIDFISMWHADLGAALLRYYWFRLSDVMLPVGTTFAALAALCRFENRWPRMVAWCFAALILLAGGNLYLSMNRAVTASIPQADAQILRHTDARRENFTTRPDGLLARYQDWRRVCDWIADNTESTDRFLTPHFQQTFKWHAGRSEVVTWKDVPQDAAALVAWRRRYDRVYPPTVIAWGLAAQTDSRLLDVAREFRAQYIVVARSRYGRPMSLPRLYPNRFEENATYEVYRVMRVSPNEK